MTSTDAQNHALSWAMPKYSERSIHLFKCERCGSVRTEESSWLSEAHSRPTPDLCLVDRNLLNAPNGLMCHAVGGKGQVLEPSQDFASWRNRTALGC